MASKLLVLVASCIASPDASPDASHLPVAFGGYEVPYCHNGGSCVPPSACAPFYLNALHDPVGAACYLAPGTPGICCVPRHTSYKKRPLLERATNPPGSESPLEFDLYTLNHAAKVGELEVLWQAEFEKELDRRRVFVNPGSAAFMHFAFFKSKPIARKLSDQSAMIIFGSQSLSERFSLTPAQAGFGLTDFSTRDTILGPNCPSGGPCDRNEKYRSYDGSCNNLENPLWGTSNSPFQRTLLPAYSDGVFKPRQAVSGDDLPSARLVSINIVPDVDAPSELDTHNVMQWGQFVDHDITHTPLFRLGNQNSSGIQCCMEDGSAPISRLVLHPECFPIEIPENDPFFKKFDQRCMNIVRSMPAPQQSCTFGYGEQMNQITHFHDASNVYGSDDEDATELREFRDGLLKIHEGTHPKGLLPQDDGELEGEECQINDAAQGTLDRKCFKAGDSRSNEQPGLTVYHTVWVREHNRLALELKYLNPHWDDEKLYQQARRILVAEMQHITYNEWLPIVLGVDFMDELDILPVTYGYSSRYDAAVNPTIINSFAAAAFRFGHTLIQGMLDMVKEVHYDRKTVSRIPLSEAFFNPELVYVPGELDKFLVGLATQPSQKYDNIITDEVTNHLFQAKNKSFGMDLVALNLQRGRDHGLPGYNAFRELCGSKKASDFNELSDLLPKQIVERLKLIYQDVDDVDLFIGGISEFSVPGALLGPTFQCLVGDQFKRLQEGDRFFYDSADNPGKFSEAQLNEIRNANLARITCDNGDNIHHMQPLAFRRPSTINPLVPCDAITIPIIDLLPWKEGYQTVSKVKVSSLKSNPGHVKSAKIVTAEDPTVSPYNYHHEPRLSHSPAPVFSRSHFNSVANTPIKPFVHTPLHRFNLNINYGR